MANNSLPVIEQKRCTSCGLCVEICPDKILLAIDGGGVSVTADRCMGCGHCQAICPAEAIAMPGLTSDLGLTTVSASSDLGGEGQVGIDSLLQVMCARRSCRAFKPDPLNVNLLSDLARIGTTAPSGTNSQGWQFVVLPERKDVVALGEVTAGFYRRLNRKAANPLYRFAARLFAGNQLERYYRNYYNSIENGLSDWYDNDIDRLFHGAPSALVVIGDRSASCPQEDALLATQNIVLAAQSLGIATCLVGFVVEAARRDKRIARLLRLGASETIYSVIGCGHPVHSFRRFAGRKPVNPRIVRLSGEVNKNKPEWKQADMLTQKKCTRLVLYSFGFKHGVPVDANMVWDVRFLPNPYWQEDLRPMSGCEQPVSDYVIKSEAGKEFLSLLKPLLLFFLDSEAQLEQKNHRFAIGCTGGRHRSVAVVEELRTFLAEHDVDLDVFHRDMEREEERE